MTTRLEFRNRLRLVLADAARWPDTALDAWLNAAIQDYSLRFPHQVSVDVETTAGERVYALTELDPLTNLYGLQRVEYPAECDPPRLLKRLAESSPLFLGGPFYDIRGGVSLVLGEAPAEGETLRVYYGTSHRLPLSDGSTLTVPDGHLEALHLYCAWQACRQLELAQAANPDTTNLLLSMLGENTARLERQYLAKLAEYARHQAPGAFSGPWGMDRFDPVY